MADALGGALDDAKLEAGGQEVVLNLSGRSLLKLWGLVLAMILGIGWNLVELRFVVSQLATAVELLPPKYVLDDLADLKRELERQQVQIDRLEGWQNDKYVPGVPGGGGNRGESKG